jgi:hypothetical protein
MKIHRRYLGCVNWPGENQQSTFPIPRNYPLVALEFELVATIARAAGTTGGPCDSAPAQLVRSLELVANGQDTIKRMPMDTLHRKNELQFGVRPRIYSEALAGFAEIAANGSTVKVAARMSFAMPRAIRQIETLLDTAALSSLDLLVTFGAGLDIMNDTFDGASVTVEDAKLHITAIEYIGVVGWNLAIWKENWKRKQVTGVDNAFQVKLPYGSNLAYRSILIKTHSDADQVDTILPYNGLAILNKMTLRSGTEVYCYEIAQLLQVQNRLAYGIQVPERTGTAAALNHRLQELVLEGYYYIDFCRDGRLTEMLDTTMLSDLELVLEVANPGSADFVEVYFDHVLPLAKKVTT